LSISIIFHFNLSLASLIALFAFHSLSINFPIDPISPKNSSILPTIPTLLTLLSTPKAFFLSFASPKIASSTTLAT